MSYQIEPKSLIFYLSCACAILSLLLVLSNRKESFDMPSITQECQIAANNYCSQICDESKDVSQFNEVALGKAVFDKCGQNYKVMDFCKATQNHCPLSRLDRIIGGTHDRAYKPLEYVRTIDAQDPKAFYTKDVTTYQW